MNPQTVADGRIGRWPAIVFLVSIQLIYAPPLAAFPPYKTTDADTADPDNLELRLGLVQVEREGGATKYASPLLRTNFGFPNKLEVISEFEYRPEENEFGDGAFGIKWAPVQGPLSFGMETLALLPVRPGNNSVGIESQLVATWRRPNQSLQVHANAGGFHDPRESEIESGWRASVLTELAYSSFRPGIEVFVKKKSGKHEDVRLGAGVIKNVGQFEIRSAVHVGLTDAAPDVVFNIWFSVKLPFR